MPWSEFYGLSYNKALTLLYTVYRVQKVGTNIIRHDGIQVLEYKKARCSPSREREDLRYAVLWTTKAGKCSDVESRDCIVSAVQRVHDCFDADGLAISGRSIIDDSSLPGDFELFVRVSAIVEVLDVVSNGILHTWPLSACSTS